MNLSPEQLINIITGVEKGIENGLDPIAALRFFVSNSNNVFSGDMPTLETIIKEKFGRKKHRAQPKSSKKVFDWGDPANAKPIVKD